jgi:hypothetical protein
MDAEFVLTLASSSWLKWFCCPNCGSDYTISKNGRCNACDEHLVLVRNQGVRGDILDGFSGNLNFLIPWQTGSSFYYHLQWNQLVSPTIEVNNS